MQFESPLTWSSVTGSSPASTLLTDPYSTDDLDQDLTALLKYTSPYKPVEKKSKPAARCPFGIPTCTGCTESAKIVEEEDEFDQHRHLWHTSLALAKLERYSLETPAIYRGRMSEEFIGAQQRKVPGLVHRNRVLGIMQNWQVAEGTVLAASVDSFLMLWLGLRSRDQVYIREGHRKYSNALRLLQNSLSKPDAATDDNVLGAVVTISACEMFHFISQGQAGWLLHAQALYAILKARGIRNVKSQFAKDMIVNFYHVGVLQAVRERKPFIFGSPDWLLFMRMLDDGDSLGELRGLTAELPEVLSQVDNLLHNPSQSDSDDPANDAIRLITRLSTLDRRLQDWLLKYYHTLPSAPYQTSTVATLFPDFHAAYPQFSSVFPITYEFSTQTLVTAHGYYWAAQLVLREAMHDLASSSAASALVTHPQRERFGLDADECADALCRMVPSAWEPDPNVESYTAFTSYFVGPVALCCPLDLVIKWYAKRGEKAAGKMALCSAVVGNVHRHLIRQGLSSPFTKTGVVEDIF